MTCIKQVAIFLDFTDIYVFLTPTSHLPTSAICPQSAKISSADEIKMDCGRNFFQLRTIVYSYSLYLQGKQNLRNLNIIFLLAIKFGSSSLFAYFCSGKMALEPSDQFYCKRKALCSACDRKPEKFAVLTHKMRYDGCTYVSYMRGL